MLRFNESTIIWPINIITYHLKAHWQTVSCLLPYALLHKSNNTLQSEEKVFFIRNFEVLSCALLKACIPVPLNSWLSAGREL